MTGLIGTFVAWTHETHYGSFPIPEVMLICMPLGLLFDYFIRPNKPRAQLAIFPKSHHLLPRRYFQKHFFPDLITNIFSFHVGIRFLSIVGNFQSLSNHFHLFFSLLYQVGANYFLFALVCPTQRCSTFSPI